MKKLLALVLCIAMVLSLAPAAFAQEQTEHRATNYPTSTNNPARSWLSTKDATDAISHAKENIDYIYGTLAADTAVFGTIKSMDGVVNGMVTDIFDGVSGNIWGLPASTLKDNVKGYMKDVIGGSVITYLNEHFDDFADVSWSRKADATTQNLVYANATIPSTTAGTTNYLYTGPNGKVYCASQDAAGNVTWYTTNANLNTAKAGDASWSKASNQNAFQNVGGTNWEVSVDKASLSYTGKTILDPAGKVNYVYTGANGQIYLLGPNAAGEYKNWGKTDATMEQVLAGNAHFDHAAVTVTQDVDYDPIAYANTFVAAVNDAFNSKQGAANIENVMYQLYSAKVWKEVDEKLDDLYDEIRTWENGSSVLDDYHFNEYLFIPYAFMSEYDLPESFPDGLPSSVFAR